MDVWKEKLCQAVKAPELKSYTSQIDPKTGMVKDDKGQEEEIFAEIRSDTHKVEGSIKSKETDIKRMPKKKSEENKKIIKIKGKTFEFDHQFLSLGSESSWKEWKFDKENKKLIIFTNIDFPAYIATKDHAFYAAVHIAEAFSEVMVREVGEEIGNIQDIKEIILRIASNLKNQIGDK